MQLVSREVLKKLAGITVEDESDATFLFSECLKSYNAFLAEADDLDKQKNIKHSDSLANKFSDRFDYAYCKVLSSYLKNHKKAFKFVDAGSSRTVFAMPGGKCLKIAQSAKGVAQNQQELKNSQSTYKCFPLVYEADSKGYGMIMVECCSPIYISDTLNDFSMAYGKGIQLIHVISVLHDIVNMCRCDISLAVKSLMHSVEQNEYFAGNENDEYEVNYELKLELCRKIQQSKEPQFEVLRDIVKFYNDNGKNDDAMLLTDIEHKANWGLAIRKNKMVPVIIDSGFSRDVSDKFYS